MCRGAVHGPHTGRDRLDHQPVGVHRNGDDPPPGRTQSVHGSGIARFLDRDRIAGLEHGQGELGHGRCRPVGGQHRATAREQSTMPEQVFLDRRTIAESPGAQWSRVRHDVAGPPPGATPHLGTDPCRPWRSGLQVHLLARHALVHRTVRRRFVPRHHRLARRRHLLARRRRVIRRPVIRLHGSPSRRRPGVITRSNGGPCCQEGACTVPGDQPSLGVELLVSGGRHGAAHAERRRERSGRGQPLPHPHQPSRGRRAELVGYLERQRIVRIAFEDERQVVHSSGLPRIIGIGHSRMPLRPPCSYT